MNKLRILNDNTVLSANASVTGSIYKHQRLEFSSLAIPFVVGEVITGSLSGALGGTITGVGDMYIDVLLLGDIEAVHFYIPNTANVNTSETITGSIAGSGVTVAGYRIPFSHPSYPPSNFVDPNRNLINPAKGYFKLDERNFHHIKASVIYTTPASVSCIAILNHNFSDTATITIDIRDNIGTALYVNTITNPNQPRFSVGTDYYQKTGGSSISAVDRVDVYKNNNIFLLYLPATYLATELHILVEDPLSTTPFSYIGNMYAGTFYELQTNMTNGWALTTIDTSTTVYAISPYSVKRPKYHTLSFTFSTFTSDERAYWSDLFLRVGTHTDFIIDLFNGSPDINDNMFSFYGRFSQPQIGFINDFGSRYSTQLTFRESI